MSQASLTIDSRPSQECFVETAHGRVWTRLVEGGQGAPLITIHGGPGSPHDYFEPLEKLSVDRPVVFYDQLGCGRSERADITDVCRMERFVEELSCVANALDLPAFHLLGHSWGTMVAFEFAQAFPSRVLSLSLASACLSMNRVRSDMSRLLGECPQVLQDVIARHQAAGTTDSMEFQVAAMAFYRRHICRLDPWPEALMRSQDGWNMEIYNTMWGPAEFAPTGSLRDYEGEDRLHKLDMPVIYLCGRYDELTPESCAAYHDQTPNSEIVVFEHSAHVAHLEETDAFINTLADFLLRNK